jgi:hypothetical protein
MSTPCDIGNNQDYLDSAPDTQCPRFFASVAQFDLKIVPSRVLNILPQQKSRFLSGTWCTPGANRDVNPEFPAVDT